MKNNYISFISTCIYITICNLIFSHFVNLSKAVVWQLKVIKGALDKDDDQLSEAIFDLTHFLVQHNSRNVIEEMVTLDEYTWKLFEEHQSF